MSTAPHPIYGRCFDRIDKPIHILGGEHSYVIVPNVAERLKQLRNVQFESIDAGHLMPMEKPQETASFVTQCISRHET